MFRGCRIEAINAVNTVCCLTTSSFIFHIFKFIKNKKAALEGSSGKLQFALKIK